MAVQSMHLTLYISNQLLQICTYSVSQTPRGFLAFFPQFDKILHASYTFLSALDYRLLLIYLQL